jgi:ATP-dependent Lon protease
MDEVPKHVRRGLKLVFVETMDDVLGAALKRPQPKRPAPKPPHIDSRLKPSPKLKPRPHALATARASIKPPAKTIH